MARPDGRRDPPVLRHARGKALVLSSILGMETERLKNAALNSIHGDPPSPEYEKIDLNVSVGIVPTPLGIKAT